MSSERARMDVNKKQDERQERLAKALRDNLRRRKAAAKGEPEDRVKEDD